jgi:hypothetical protein
MIVRNNNKIARYKGWPAESMYNYYASGGIITYDGDYKIHTFNVSDNFIVNNIIDISTLIVGAGGCGGPMGGGGGGFVQLVNFTLSPSTYYVTVGHCPADSNGTSSYFNGIESNGGLRGFNDGGTSASGKSGGIYIVDTCGQAGGGGGGNSTTGGIGSILCFPPPDEIMDMAIGGSGGLGTHSSISGIDKGYGGGGAGFGYTITSGNSGVGYAEDGGGAGAPGTPNTGGGGGTIWFSSEIGGSGVVIIRYKYK